MSLQKRFSAVLMLLSLILLLTACGGAEGVNGDELPLESDPTIKVLETTTPTPAPTPEPTPLPYLAPFAGIRHETEVSARPVVVMVNNYAAARPQSGLTNADVIWEVLAEGGITRLIAVYQSTDALADTIGPIRSIRPYLIEIGESYGGVLAHAGASHDGYVILQRQGKPYLDEISNAGSYFFRSKERKAPHNLYSSLEKLREGAERKGYHTDLTVSPYPFAENGSTEAGVPASDISIKFTLKNYKVGYTYDPLTGLYKRSINDEPHIDLNNSEQLSGTNLVVLGADHKTLDNEGRLAVDLKKGGAAILFQKGKAIEAQWVRSDDGMIRIELNGTELPLVPGKTFFHIVPNKPTFEEHVTWVQSEGSN